MSLDQCSDFLSMMVDIHHLWQQRHGHMEPSHGAHVEKPTTKDFPDAAIYMYKKIISPKQKPYMMKCQYIEEISILNIWLKMKFSRMRA